MIKVEILKSTPEKTHARISELLSEIRSQALGCIARERVPSVLGVQRPGELFDVIELWHNRRGVSPLRAMIEIAHVCDRIGVSERDYLLTQVGEDPRQMHGKPRWCSDSGELIFNGHLVGRLQMRKRPTATMVILNAFEAAGWPTNISNPLPVDTNLDIAVLRLKEGIQEIYFFVHARQVCWRLAKVLHKKRKTRAIAK